jgi:hypothetical protein
MNQTHDLKINFSQLYPFATGIQTILGALKAPKYDLTGQFTNSKIVQFTTS